jgi:hypothetical protein
MRMMIKYIKYHLIILLFPLLLNAQNYLWPTNASNYLTSTFCEYRPGHYHSAIDIKTWNKEGYPCYAVEDGYIYRLRVSTVGYGKAFYIKLNDGHFAVYAHLQRFSPKIEKMVREKQIKNRKYTLSWYLKKKIYVKKGEIIGYSGQTGIGVPHLHFEIRDSLEHPLNPLHYYKDKIKDDIAPVLQSLMIIPRDENSTVNGSFLPKKIKLYSKGNGEYIIKKPLVVSGNVGLAIKGYDRANGVHNAFSFYRSELFAAGKKIFKLQYDWMDFANSKEVDLEIYYPERAFSKKVYHQLFIEPVTTLQYYDRSLGDGIINMDRGEVPFKIVVHDFFGNRSVINGKLLSSSSGNDSFTVLSKVDSTAYFKLKIPNGLKDLQLFAANKMQLWERISYYEILTRKKNGNSEELMIYAVMPLDSCYDFKVQYITSEGSGSSFACSAEPKNSKIVFNAQSLGKFLVLKFKSKQKSAYSYNLDLQIGLNKTRIPIEFKNKWCEKVIPARFLKSEFLKIKLSSFNKVVFDTLLHYSVFGRGSADTASLKNIAAVRSFVNSFYDTTIIRIRKGGINRGEIDMPILSPMVNIEPNYQILKNPVSLSIVYQGHSRYLQKLGIYKLKSYKGFSYVGGIMDSSLHTISTKTAKLGRFFVGLDTIPPQIKIILPKYGKVLKSNFKIKFKTIDLLSGIAAEDDISVTLDGNFVLPEWDPETKTVVARPHWKVKKGTHVIMISVKDAVGNQSQKIVNIRVK